jgi:phosphate transport system permease protein
MTILAPPVPEPEATAEDRPTPLHAAETGADLVFRRVLATCSATVLFLLAAVTLFLIIKGWPAMRMAGIHFFTDSVWAPDNHRFGVAPLLVGSVAIAVVAVAVAAPVSLCTALMINEYVPRFLRSWLTSIVDILATIPSIVYGFWGLEIFSSFQSGPAAWLSHYFGFVPFFRTPQPSPYLSSFYAQSILATGLVCALTIIPVITSVSREVMAQVPRDACEAALGLGGTRWGMVTDVILPFSRIGNLGAVLLGIGRGLGETMIVVLVLSSAKKLTPAILGPNGLGSIAKEITEYFADGSAIEKSALILAGLALFATTLAVNAVARLIVVRAGGRV